LIRQYNLGIALIICLTCTHTGYAAHLDPGCDLPAERKFIDAVFNHDFDAARVAVNSIELEHSLIPSTPFYDALAGWVYSLQTDDVNQRKDRLSQLRMSVRELESFHSSKQSAGSLLAWGLAGAHTARILLFEQHVISGYYMGNRAVENLQQYTRDAASTVEGRHAARLVIGLHQIYSNAIPDELEWAEFLVKPVGDIDHGRELILRTLKESRYLSPEAARVLLLEVPWSTPGVCEYQELGREMTEHYPGNPDFSIALQGILLRCGRPESALVENKRISTAGYHSVLGRKDIDYPDLMQLGRFRAFADTGDVESIRRETPGSDHMETFRQYALANALDISGQRNHAVAVYKSLSDDSTAPVSIRKSSKLREEFPYIAAETIDSYQSPGLMICN
jgi:hypothetical protein